LRRQPERQILAAARGGDEGAVARRAGEDDVARLVADEQGADHARRRGADIDDADAVREVVHHPDLAIAARRDGYRLEADRHRGEVRQPATATDGEDLEATVGGVDGEQPGS